MKIDGKTKRKIKIGVITHNFPEKENDRKNAGIFVYDFVKALSKKAEIVVFSPGALNSVKKVGGIKTYFFRFKYKLGSLKIYNPADLYKFISFFYKGRLKLEQFLSENKDLDFIIAMWAFPAGFFANSIYKSNKIPYATYSLGSDIYIYAKKPLLKNVIKKYLEDARLLLADSPDLANEVEAIVKRKTLFLPSASNFSVANKVVRKISSKITFTFLGRLELVKGIDILLDALEKVKNNQGKFEVNIIGDGSLLEPSQNRFKDYSAVKFWGNISDFNKIAGILKNSDWLVIPSRSDSIPLVFSEAMKVSLPVIVSDLPDLKYLVNKYRVGKVFKKESTSELSKILIAIIQGKIKRKDFISSTAKAAEIFDLKKSSATLLDLIRKNIS